MNDRFYFRCVFEKDFGGKTGIIYKMFLFNLDDTDSGVLEETIKSYTDFGYKLIAKEQCIGKKDKNGTLIYEGDILKETYFFENKQCKDITVVKWLDDSASFVMEHIGCENDFTYFNDYDVNLENFEIIGNQYENQELLNH